MGANRNPLGERRSRKFTAYFQVPHGQHPGDVKPYIWKYVALKEKEGWRAERVLNVRKDSIGNITEHGLMDVWLFDVILSRPVRAFNVEVSDKAAQLLINKGLVLR